MLLYNPFSSKIIRSPKKQIQIIFFTKNSAGRHQHWRSLLLSSLPISRTVLQGSPFPERSPWARQHSGAAGAPCQTRCLAHSSRGDTGSAAPRGWQWLRGDRGGAGRWEAGLPTRRCARWLLSVHNLEVRSKSPALPAVHNPSGVMHWFCRAPSVPRAPGTAHGSSDAGESCRCLWCPVPSSLSLPGPCSGEETMS